MTRRRKWDEAITIGLSKKMLNYLNAMAEKEKCSRYSFLRQLIVLKMHEKGIIVRKEIAFISLEREEAGGSYWNIIE